VTDASHDQLARAVRQHAGQLAASLMHVTGDFATAEDLVQDAVLAALQHWPAEGIPDRPGAWLFTVARRRGLDALRREANYRTKLAQLQWPVSALEHLKPAGRSAPAGHLSRGIPQRRTRTSGERSARRLNWAVPGTESTSHRSWQYARWQGSWP
jgi:DNA-directed RNA polymerase specialized sigma24 family protein